LGRIAILLLVLNPHLPGRIMVRHDPVFDRLFGIDTYALADNDHRIFVLPNLRTHIIGSKEDRARFHQASELDRPHPGCDLF
jgi:hypothetical protein